MSEGYKRYPIGLLNDRQIKEICRAYRMISPFDESKIMAIEPDAGVPRSILSYGLEGFEYCLRASDEVKLLVAQTGNPIDPKEFEPVLYTTVPERDKAKNAFLIPPHTTALVLTVETLTMPPSILGLIYGKSTYDRVGLMTFAGQVKPGWSGRLIVEMFNANDAPILLYAGEGICSLTFVGGEMPEGGAYRGVYDKQKSIKFRKATWYPPRDETVTDPYEEMKKKLRTAFETTRKSWRNY